MSENAACDPPVAGERAEGATSARSSAAASTDELCAHGCGYRAVVQHADGRVLCRSCYAAEMGEIPGVNPCPTCGTDERPAACVWEQAANLVQSARHGAEITTARCASDNDFDLEAYWRARAEGLADAEKILRCNAEEAKANV